MRDEVDPGTGEVRGQLPGSGTIGGPVNEFMGHQWDPANEFMTAHQNMLEGPG